MLGELTDFDQVSNEGFSGLKDQGLMRSPDKEI